MVLADLNYHLDISLEGLNEEHTPLLEYLTPGPIFELETTRVWSRSTNHHSAALSKLGTKTDGAVGNTVRTSQLQSNTIYTSIMSRSN